MTKIPNWKLDEYAPKLVPLLTHVIKTLADGAKKTEVEQELAESVIVCAKGYWVVDTIRIDITFSTYRNYLDLETTTAEHKQKLSPDVLTKPPIYIV